MQQSSESYFIKLQDVEKLVNEYIAEFFFLDISEIKRELRFEEDICADAFVLADCIDALEEEIGELSIGYKIDHFERSEIETVGNLIDAISVYVVQLSDRNR